MTYQVLARKWRPKTFARLKGQEHVTRALLNSFKLEQLHHAYLFTGTRGIGKTTIARLLAKAFNCETPLQGEPCGQCTPCLEIDAGICPDLIEIDAASKTRIEDIREILDNVQYLPTKARFKVYLIDEVHMLSTHSFNALLKTLEEPPPHVKFILATTDLTRVPMTVLSRCLRFNLSSLSVTEIVEELSEILSVQQMPFEINALKKIAICAQGSMRDALSLMEQALVYCQDKITIHGVEEILGLSYQRELPLVLTALATQNIKQALECVEKLAQTGCDFIQVLNALLQVFYALAVIKAVPGAKSELNALAQIDEDIINFANDFSAEEVQLFYQIALIGKQDILLAPDLRIGFEMILIRMFTFCPYETKSKDNTIKKVIKEDKQTEQVKQTIQEPSPFSKITSNEKPPLITIEKTSTLVWEKIVDNLNLSAFTRVLARHCLLKQWDGKHLELMLDNHQKALLNDERVKQIQKAISEYLKQAIILSIVPGQIEGLTPMMLEEQAQSKKTAKVNEMIQNDKGLQSLIKEFDATIEKIESHLN